MRTIGTPRPTADGGQANLFLLVGLTLSLLAIMLLFVRLGNANDLRSQSQTAADAAALAAAAVARDTAAEELANNQMPYSRLYDPARGRAAAERYAQANGAVLEDIRASDDSQGNLGNVIRVEVSSSACQRELQEDRGVDWVETSCEGATHEDAHVGNAASIVEVVIPECEYGLGTSFGLTCEGTSVQSVQQARQLIDIRIVEEEGQYIYKPLGGTEETDPSTEA